jgi:hypothetical protein
VLLADIMPDDMDVGLVQDEVDAAISVIESALLACREEALEEARKICGPGLCGACVLQVQDLKSGSGEVTK